MASWQIDYFSVKPSGFLASWRYARVLVDENGNVSYTDVPGKPNINQNCISNYNKKDRRYPSSLPSTPANQKTASLITEFCNRDTFTNYRIYASDCKPFAYAETDLNAPKCGYLTPEPKPADPPNPYGTLYYLNYKYTEFCNSIGENIRVDILRKYNYTKPQTTLLVDSFSKPGAYYPIDVKVYVNRITHEITFTGQAFDDSGSNRTHAPNTLITEICDLETGTNLKVYAQSASPFVYLVEEPNSPSCQLPVNPDPEYIENWGNDPVVLSYKGDDNKLTEIVPCECILTFLSSGNFSLAEFYTNDEREFKVIVTREGQRLFEGFIIPDSCQEPFLPPPYEVQIRATDGLGALKNITYPIPLGSKIDIKQKWIEIIAYCLAATNLSLDIRTISNIYETTMNNGMDDDPLNQSYVNPLRFTGDNGQLMNCYDVLIAVCKQFKATIFQSNGEFVFARRDELASDFARSRVYNSKALFKRSEQIYPLKDITNMDTPENVPINMDQTIFIGNPYKRASVLVEYGKSPSIVFNGDFELWDGQNFTFWTKYGNMIVDQRQRFVIGSGGAQIPINNYALLFKERAQSNKWLQSNEISVIKGDSIRFTFSHSPIFAIASIKIRIKLGIYYLTNSINGVDFEWTTALSTVTVRLWSNIFNYTERTVLNFTFPDAPESGIMVIQLFGVQMYDVHYNSNQIPVYTENTNYYALDIDDLSISKQSKVDDKKEIGQLYIAEQSGFYTQKPERETLLFGDFVSKNLIILGVDTQIIVSNTVFGITGQIPIGNTASEQTIVQDNLYAIYTGDKSYSTSWYEYGNNSGRVPIGMLMAKSRLKSYQSPFYYIGGSYLAINAAFVNTYRYDFDCIPDFGKKIFALLSADIGIKSNTITNANMVEMFDKYIKTTDISGPSYPGDLEPPISNNPNTPPIIPIDGIFTDEFTEQFE